MTAELPMSETLPRIAVVGMAARFPGAASIAAFWDNLRRGVESVTRLTEDELRSAGESAEAMGDPDYVRACPSLEGVGLFDAAFFGLSPRDAALMDPQHRLFLELAWEALEDAGCDPESPPGPIGVFAASGANTYLTHHLLPNRELLESVGEWLLRHSGNDMNFVATRASYLMNLRGPSLNVQTACSSSLVAIHLACQSLLGGECDVALAGASTMSLPQDRGYLYKPGEILSRDGHCRPFDASATGTLFGSGAGCVVLKRLADALASGDRILAVVRGSAINNDGARKVGYLAPSVDGQASAIAEALAVSGVAPETIGYVEAHGTGTRLGDPIELAALTQAFRAHTAKVGFCAIGSVKGNIGHLGEAAGMAGFIKTVLTLGHRLLPPSIHCDVPNPALSLGTSPFFVNGSARPWEAVRGYPRRAGVTALGAGGTNAHVVLEEAPEATAPGPSRTHQLLLLSAKSQEALERMATRLGEHLAAHPEANLADIAHTLRVGRTPLPHRLALVCSSVEGGRTALAEREERPLATRHWRGRVPALVFMFPGGGAQYAGMGRELHEDEPVYRRAFEECLSALDPHLAASLRRLLLQEPDELGAATRELERPSLSLPALFTVELATAALLRSWGLVPSAMVGHSVGEYVAACLSGVMSMPDALGLVALRGRLFETLPEGAMLSVPTSLASLHTLLDGLSVAATNAPELVVVSGPVDAIGRLEKRLSASGIDSTRLHIGVAAHSTMVEPLLGSFERQLRGITLRAPEVPFASNVTGTWIRPEEATDPDYWVRHLRSAVRFAEGVATVAAGGERTLLEVGPGRTLSSLAVHSAPDATLLPTLRHPQETTSDLAFLLTTLGRLWLAGHRPSWAGFSGDERRQRVALPSYPFDRRRHWVDASPRGEPAPHEGPPRKKPDVSDWFSLPSWRRSIPGPRRALDGPWLLFADDLGVAASLEPRLSQHSFVVVTPGARFARLSDTHYTLRPGQLTDYEALFEQLDLAHRLPRNIVHLWNVVAKAPWSARTPRGAERLRRFDATKELSFDSLVLLAQVLGHRETPIRLTIVTNDLFALPGHRSFASDRALLLGPARVIPRELPHLRVAVVDLSLHGKSAEQRALAEGQLFEELLSATPGPVVAHRDGERWVESLDDLRVGPAPASRAGLRAGGVYVISGGLGGLGLTLAAHLARSAKVKLVLLGRTALPPRRAWASWLRARPLDPEAERRLRAVLRIEETGSEVLYLTADVTDPAQVEAALAAARARFGAVHGVIHAAGTLDDGLLALKELDSATAVIATKAKGALVLDELLRRDPLDFFIVFSSVSARLGLEGQIDYTAANAFLDAFAEQRTAAGRGRTVSIGWSTWQSVGMAAARAERGPAARVPARDDLRSLSLEEDATSGARRVFRARVSLAEHWLLSEHVLRSGEAVMPGTGYIELVRAALTRSASLGHDAAVELADVLFVAPFTVPRDEPLDLCLKLVPRDDGQLDFAFWSAREDLPHAVGRISLGAATPPAPEDLEAARARCEDEVPAVDGFLVQPFVDFGPRWGNVVRIRRGPGEAILDLRLPTSCEPDLAELGVHPALLDMATGGAQHLIAGFDPARDFYVPLSYERIRVHGALPSSVVSHVRLLPGDVAGFARFDVTIHDPRGRVLVEITSFTMKRLDARAAFAGRPEGVAPIPTTVLGAALRQGITPEEGMEAFDRVLRSPVPSRVFVSSVDLTDWLLHLDEVSRATTRAALPGAGAGAGSARPNLGTTFVAPRDEVERELAVLWQEMLGVSRVGIHDDFFELGGQSLVAVRMFGKIRDRYHVDLPLSTLFEAPTIAGAARIVRDEANLPKPLAATPTGVAAPRGAPVRALRKSTRWSSLVPMQTRGALPPFFCVAGMGGTLNNLRKLALLVGDARPFYGLQPPGVEDASQRLYRVEALAAHYITQVRALRPAGPYFLGGYSGGGVVAFEMSRQLAASGEEIAFIGMIDSFSPHLPLRPLAERARIHLARAEDLGASYLLDTLERRLHHESSKAKRGVARLLGQVFPVRYRYQNLADSWLIAEQSYRPVPTAGRATLFRAREESALSLWTAFQVDAEHGWTRYLRGGVEVQICPGNHATMCEEPHVRVLAARLREALRRADSAVLERQAAE